MVTLEDRWNDIAIFRMYRIVVSGDKTIIVSEVCVGVIAIQVLTNLFVCRKLKVLGKSSRSKMKVEK